MLYFAPRGSGEKGRFQEIVRTLLVPSRDTKQEGGWKAK